MKKKAILLFSLLCLFGTVTLFAGRPVTVISGDVSVLKQKSTAHLEFDFSNTKVGTQTLAAYLKEHGSDWENGWPTDKVWSETCFTGRFNNYSGKMQIEPETQNVDYKIVVHIINMDMGNAAGVFIPYAPATAGGVVLNGTVDIIDMKTKNVVLSLNVDKLQGESSPSARLRMALAFTELAERMRKLK